MKSLTPTTPHVIFMVGVPGAGKTTFAEHFAGTFQAPLVSTHNLASRVGVDVPTAVKVTAAMLDELLKTQRTIIYDGPAGTKAARMQLMRLAHQAGYRSFIIWVQTDTAESRRRSLKNSHSSGDQFDAALSRFHAPTIGEGAVVISGKHTYATQLKVVLKHLASLQRPSQTSAATPERSPRAPRNITVR